MACLGQVCTRSQGTRYVNVHLVNSANIIIEQYYNIEVEGSVADRFWAVWKKLDLTLPSDKSLSYIFDLTITETTRFKVPGKEYYDSITFLGKSKRVMCTMS